jgi:GntR family transcriptional repressor for pyruvate dehydrogenase complex
VTAKAANMPARRRTKTAPRRGSTQRTSKDGQRRSEQSIVPIARETLSARVAQALQEYVLQKHLRAGDRLPSERVLSHSFQVSIPVIREALRTLEAKGVLRTLHGRGIFVHDPAQARVGHATAKIFSDVSAAELGAARVAFESGLADLICARATGDDCDALEAILTPVKSGEAFTVHTDLDFHLRLLHAARNSVLTHLGESLLRQFFRLTAIARPDVALGGHSTLGAADQLERHLAIVRAVRDRDADRLRETIQRHLDNVPGFKPW